jgi:AcrR family transcriptional regulator
MEATWRVVQREGLGRATMRAIAAELGTTTGAVVHYFPSKDDLLLFALDRVQSGLEQALDRVAQGYEGLERLERMVLKCLPAAPKSEAAWRVWVAFVGESIGNARLVSEHRRRYSALRARITREVRLARSQGRLRSTLPIGAEVNALIAFADGIGMAWLINPEIYTPAYQRQLVRHYFRRLSSAA